MNDKISLAGKLLADIAECGPVSRRILLRRLGMTAGLIAAASLATAVPVPAQTTQGTAPKPEAKPPPKRRGISSPDAPGASPAPATKGPKSGEDDNTVP